MWVTERQAELHHPNECKEQEHLGDVLVPLPLDWGGIKRKKTIVLEFLYLCFLKLANAVTAPSTLLGPAAGRS